MDIATYKLDEKQAIKSFVFTDVHDAIADRFEAEILARKRSFYNAFLDAIGALADGGVCLDVGSSYGAQYFALKQMFPNVKYKGVEVAPEYIKRFRARLASGEAPDILLVDDYTDLSELPDNSCEVVTARSVLRHYTFEHGSKIIDEMLRVASKAVVILFITPPIHEKEIYTEAFGDWTGKGYFIEWEKAAWEKYLENKKVGKSDHELVVILEK